MITFKTTISTLGPKSVKILNEFTLEWSPSRMVLKWTKNGSFLQIFDSRDFPWFCISPFDFFLKFCHKYDQKEIKSVFESFKERIWRLTQIEFRKVEYSDCKPCRFCQAILENRPFMMKSTPNLLNHKRIYIDYNYRAKENLIGLQDNIFFQLNRMIRLSLYNIYL